MCRCGYGCRPIHMTSVERASQLAEATQQQLVKRTHFYQRLIKKLHERIKVAEESARRPRSPPKEAALLADRDRVR